MGRKTNPAALAAIAQKCPTLTPGEVWIGAFGRSDETQVLRVGPSEELPWPIVGVRFADGTELDVGAPAFIGARLVRRRVT